MKTIVPLLAVALSSALNLLAADHSDVSLSASTIEQKSGIQLANPFEKTAKKETPIIHVHGLSNHAWSTTVGWRPGQSAFADERTHEATLTLLWIGCEPRR